jgi:diguanylate cyclase (GGDEF)-like protein
LLGPIVRARTLPAAFLTVSLLIVLVGLLAVREQYTASRYAAQIEARHLAESIAHTVAQIADVGDGREPELYQQPDRLQRYLADVHQNQHRDTEVIGLDGRILADVIPGHQGEVFTEDAHGEVGATMRDGRPRSFTERSPDYPQGVLQMVIPLRTDQGRIVGAVLMEYTPIYRELLAAGAGTRRTILAASLTGLVLALLVGFLLARSLVRDLRQLRWAAGRLADGHDTRAEVRGRGELAELAATFNDMAARIAAQKAVLTEVAISDPLTGLHNRRSFEVRLAEEVARTHRSGVVFSLLLVDLDHFKSINDRYGHPAGDQALRHVAAVLKDELREVDFLARIGGEEFAVLLSATSGQGAMQAAERIRAAIAGQPASYEDTTLTMTASMGVAWYPAHADTDKELIRVVDQALYEAKRSGRDRTCCPEDVQAQQRAY